MLELGAEKLNAIIKKGIPCISGFIRSHQILKHNFPTDVQLLDNRWLTQPVFYNKNITMKDIAKNRQRRPLTLSEMGFKPRMETIQLKDLFTSGKFKSKVELEILNQGTILPQSYYSFKCII